MVGARGEEQGVGRSGIGTVAERQAPEAADRDGFPADVHELAGGRELVRPTLRELEGVDPAIAEIADQELVADSPEVARCQGDAPWRVQRASRRDPLEQIAAGVEDVDEAAAPARGVVVLVGVLLGVGDEQELCEVPAA